MTIQQCKYVLEILRVGSFNEASKTLFVAQSSLSSSVKTLEKELGIKIFERTNNGVLLTGQGAEFVRHASRIVEQNDFILKNYKNNPMCQTLHIATQHYDFVADIFGKMINSINDEAYKISLKETQTYDVIKEVENGYSDIGIIALKNYDYDIMTRFLLMKKLTFVPFIKAAPHIYVRKNHHLSNLKKVTYQDLKNFPYVSYEQGKHSSSLFTEEIMEEESMRHIEISDRASLMNVLLTTDCYTIGTGIMPSELNEGKIISIPLESDAYYNIGYMLNDDRKCSDLTLHFIELLTKAF